MNDDRGWKGEGLILVCDDDAAVRRVTVRLIQWLGFDVIEACDGQDALDAFVRSGPALRAVVLDVTMPRRSGLEVFASLRAQRADIPVVLMSGHDESRLQVDLCDAHACFLNKPFTWSDLRRALMHVLDPS